MDMIAKEVMAGFLKGKNTLLGLWRVLPLVLPINVCLMAPTGSEVADTVDGV
jgi:hypothetical protein